MLTFSFARKMATFVLVASNFVIVFIDHCELFYDRMQLIEFQLLVLYIFSSISSDTSLILVLGRNTVGKGSTNDGKLGNSLAMVNEKTKTDSLRSVNDMSDHDKMIKDLEVVHAQTKAPKHIKTAALVHKRFAVQGKPVCFRFKGMN